ncbi:hypothetical protein [Streptomyces sp. TRM68416]|uniref:hypothetical protein n=1 Tax=Streptomyces sp. TRM68416 TaxID=2758412 RepID=UPI001661D4A6|nr:hypothetical protein [Streptomyces sp. TRM68416]MBD0839151.1 hypothetical protein [Streptomyces sp. TRM68416]
MDRHVHHELRWSVTALTVSASCAPLTVNVHGTLFSPGGLHLFLAGLVGLPALLTLLQATHIKWVGGMRDFETAVALAAPRAEKSLLRRPLNPWLFAIMAPVTPGPDPEKPWRLSFSPRPLTRTAIGALPE